VPTSTLRPTVGVAGDIREELRAGEIPPGATTRVKNSWIAVAVLALSCYVRCGR